MRTIRTFIFFSNNTPQSTRERSHKAHNLNVHRKLKTKRWIRSPKRVLFQRKMYRPKIFSGNGLATNACGGCSRVNNSTPVCYTRHIQLNTVSNVYERFKVCNFQGLSILYGFRAELDGVLSFLEKRQQNTPSIC